MRGAARAVAALLAAALLLLITPASAQDRAQALASFAEAERADAALSFAEAARLYGASVEADPSSPRAGRARQRAQFLARRAEGDFAPLVALERVRRAPAEDADAIERLGSAAAGFPPGLVRSEARLLCASAWAGRLEAPERAAPLLVAVAEDEQADPVIRRAAMDELVAVRRRQGALGEAARELAQWPEATPRGLATSVRREARRPWIRGGALAVLAVLAGIGAVSAWRLASAAGARALGQSVRPAHAIFAVYLAAAGGALAHAYDGTTPIPFLLLGAAVLVIAVIGRTWALSSGPGGAWLRSLTCAAAVVSAAFLALDLTEPRYLEGFGL